YVRVSAYNGYGDSLTTEAAVLVISPTNTGSINVTITGASPGATGYHVWGPSLTPGTELLNGVSLSTTAAVTGVPSGSPLFPLLDTSACKGFCNIPKNSRTNYGVTFVLEGKAGVCVGRVVGGACTSDDPHPFVLLAPFCGAAAGTGMSAFPAGATDANATTYVCPGSAVSTNDGVFTFYGPSEGTFWTGTDLPGGVFGMTGVMDLPRAALKIDGYRFHVVPGQVIAHNVDIKSANALDPLIFWGQPPPPAIQVRIIQ
ncbi:MAG: hypothetical protein M3010_07500, partial [Candidatus Dormibacteraeota bacterium]|nr:hypothetical protein [Candidatus Dormibacteraeota bacterium]